MKRKMKGNRPGKDRGLGLLKMTRKNQQILLLLLLLVLEGEEDHHRIVGGHVERGGVVVEGGEICREERDGWWSCSR